MRVVLKPYLKPFLDDDPRQRISEAAISVDETADFTGVERISESRPLSLRHFLEHSNKETVYFVSRLGVRFPFSRRINHAASQASIEYDGNILQ